MYGFKLEGGGGGNCLKGVFANFWRLKEILCKKPDLGIQFAKNKAQNSKALEKQSVVSHKQSVVYTSKKNRNNWN